MASHTPLPTGTISTKVLLFLIALIIVGVATTLISCHFLLKPDKASAVATTVFTLSSATLALDAPNKATG